MAETEITFHNNVEIRVQAQLFADGSLISTCVAGPGESRSLPAEVPPYDVYLKDSTTGWELARHLNSAATTLTLSRHKGRYLITGN
ncbi:MAG: hypothetical protein R6X32_10440 [Chloroflexota bacterium]|jgi:hypothetical protein